MSGPDDREEGPGLVSGLWRYPASSLAGQSVDEMAVDAAGAEGDRLFGLVDASTGEIASPDADRKWHGAPLIAARIGEGGGLEVMVPGGNWLPAPGEAADRAASAFLGFAVSIRPYRQDRAREGIVAAPRYIKDPIHLLTTASLAEVRRLHPTGDPDTRRFRPNILVDLQPAAGRFPETEWVGRRIAIGALELTVTEACRRCGFTIIAQDGLANDPDILRTLVKHNAHNLGVYCAVTRPGRIRLGDAMRLIPQ
ncbi:MOSC domain-containing protein [Mesorhizobium sp. ZMM04-5]|uniref:MOSC domain-containing protein n=1 Tax=Mesorhizobium marinum TaxID=3228790 RepID=A0ABV3QXU2_9HYPH